MTRRVPLDPDLYADVVAEAKARFDVWPSAYASGWVVKTYKERGGRYAGEARGEDTGLTKWFGEEWVDLSRPIYDEGGTLVGYEPCGRKRSDDPADYPKCRPLKEAMRMSPAQVKDAIKRKRAAEAKAAKGRGGARAPVRVATYRENPDAPADLWEAIEWANDGYLEPDEVEALKAEIEKHPRVRVRALDEVLEDTFLVKGHVVIVDGDDFKVLSPSQWVADEMESFRSDSIKDKVEYMLAERFNEDFQEGPVTLWHATPSENLDSILKNGLRAESVTRVLTNRSVGAAIFTSDNEEAALYGPYGDAVLEIDCKAMKRDGVSFYVEQEPAVIESEAASVLASAVGATDFDWHLFSDGADDPSTVILHIARVPPKYLRVVKGTMENPSDDIFYHTTSFASVDSIAANGLRPRRGAGVYSHGGYGEHSQGKVFLAGDKDAALAWYGKIQDMLWHEHSDDEEPDELVPVMLRIDLSLTTLQEEVDPLGDRDVPGSYFVADVIPPDAIEFFDPSTKEWTPIEDWSADAYDGVESIEYFNDDGDVVDEDDTDEYGEQAWTARGFTVYGPYDNGGFKPSMDADGDW